MEAPRSNDPSEQVVLDYSHTLSNWGRWGADDRLGTLNLITPVHRQRAASLANEGITISCGLDIRPNRASKNATLGTPPQRYMAMTCDRPFGDGSRVGVAAEWVGMLYHGVEITHLDALSHVAWDGHLFNGVPSDAVTALGGATRLAVTDAARGIVGRGVLVDVPALGGRRWLEPGEAVRPADLDAACARQGLVVGEGDVVLLHTGQIARRHHVASRSPVLAEGNPGWHASVLPWLHARSVAAIGADVANDVRPSGYPAIPDPIHSVGIVAMGLWLIDNCDLTELAATCEELGRWEFLFVLAGLRLEGGTGSPVNPLAIL